MLSKDAKVVGGRVLKVTDQIYKGFQIYKSGEKDFTATNEAGARFTGTMPDIQRGIDKYWEKKDAEEVLKGKSKDASPDRVEVKREKVGWDVSAYQNGTKVNHAWGQDKTDALRKATIFAESYTDENGQGLDIVTLDSTTELPIGKHDDIPDSEFDPNELYAGIKHEMEHTEDENVAKSIAKDHLCELRNYYSLLEAMESEAKGK
jgi:hypothetical protein